MAYHKSNHSLHRGLSFHRGDEDHFTVSSPPPPPPPLPQRWADTQGRGTNVSQQNAHHRRASSNAPRVRMPKPRTRYVSEQYQHDPAAYRPRDTSGNFIQPFNFSMSSGLDVSSFMSTGPESESDLEKPVPPPHRVPTNVTRRTSRPHLLEPDSHHIAEQFSALGLYDIPFLGYDAVVEDGQTTTCDRTRPANVQTSPEEDAFFRDVQIANEFVTSDTYDESRTRQPVERHPCRLTSIQVPPESPSVTLPEVSQEEHFTYDGGFYDPYSGFYGISQEPVEENLHGRSNVDESPSDQGIKQDLKLFSPEGTDVTHHSNESLSTGIEGGYSLDYDYLDLYPRPLPSPPTNDKRDSSSASSSTPARTASLPCHAPKNNDAIYRSNTNPNSTVYDTMSSVEFPIISTARSRERDSSKLSSDHFKSCREPWACSAIVAWLKDLFMDDFDLKKHTLVDATIALFTHKVPTMNFTEAETLSQHLVQTMLDEGVLTIDEEWLKFEPKTISGVIPQITGKGCYAPRLHNLDSSSSQEVGRCYSRYCTRALKKLSPSWNSPPNEQEWHVYWNISLESMKDYSELEITRQNNLHEVITHSERIVRALNVLLTVFVPRILDAPISKSRKSSIQKFFRKAEAIRNLYKENLMPRLKYRQREQGPFISSISDILRDFIRTSPDIHTDYAGAHLEAAYILRREIEDNVAFDTVLKAVQKDPLAERHSYEDCCSRPVKFLPQLKLVVEKAWKHTEEEEEKTNLKIVIDELQEINAKIDRRTGEKQDQHSLYELKRSLVFRDNVHKVSLGLDKPGRALLYKGSFSRAIIQGYRMTDVHVAVLDNYMIMYKERDSPKRNEVNRPPIPISLLVLEGDNDEPVVKTSIKGLVPVSNTSAPKHHSLGPSLPLLPNTAMAAIQRDSSTKLQQQQPLQSIQPSQQNLLYPFTIKHLGHVESHVLYTSDPKARDSICQVIKQAKEDHLNKIQRTKTEPFRLHVLCNNEFRYPDSTEVPSPFVLSNTALHRAIEEKRMSRPPASRELPICCANINCATTFTTATEKVMMILGTDTGLYLSSYSQSPEWQRLPICAHQRVTQISVLEEFDLFLALVDNRMVMYDLNKLAQSHTNTGAQSPPRKLSKRGEIEYFSVGSMRNRVVLVYKRRAMGGQVLEMLEPVVEEVHGAWPPYRTCRKEGFRLFNTFNASSDFSSVSIFNRLISVTTSKGIAIMNPDARDILCVVPTVTEHDPPDAERNRILNKIRNTRPLTMLRYDQDNYLLVYAGCAVMIDKYGQLNNCILHRFAGAPNTVCIHMNYLILVYDELVEIINSIDGRQRQMIAGRNIKLIDDGGNVSSDMAHRRSSHPLARHSRGKTTGFGIARTPKVAMQHPTHPRQQIIIELIET